MKFFKKIFAFILVVAAFTTSLVNAQENTAEERRSIQPQNTQTNEPLPQDGPTPLPQDVPPVFNGEGFTLVPAEPNSVNSRKFIFELRPGEILEDYVIVKNLSQENGGNFYLYGADPTFSAQGTPAYKTRDATGQGEGKWVTFDEPMMYLEPLEEKRVKFTLKAPTDAPYGDYRIGIAMEKVQQDSNNNAITIATRVILHAEIKLTDNPTVIAKNTNDNNVASSPTLQNQPWRSYYFWVSLGLFLVSLIVLILITWKERRAKNLSLAAAKAAPSASIASVSKVSKSSKAKRATTQKVTKKKSVKATAKKPSKSTVRKTSKKRKLTS